MATSQGNSPGLFQGILDRDPGKPIPEKACWRLREILLGIRPIRVILWGLGAMGSGVARLLLDRDGFIVSGAIDSDPAKAGHLLRAVVGLDPHHGSDRNSNHSSNHGFDPSWASESHAGSGLAHDPDSGYDLGSDPGHDPGSDPDSGSSSDTGYVSGSHPSPAPGSDAGSETGSDPDRHPGCDRVASSAEQVLGNVEADVAVLCTGSFIRVVRPQIVSCLESGLNVVTIAEEMANPWARHHEEALDIDRLARSRGLRVLGTGVNPGFVMDTLIVALAAVCTEIRGIRVRRANDLSGYGPLVLSSQGVGLTPEEFDLGVRAGTVVGHVGFPQSAQLIAGGLGWTLDRVDEEKKPIIAGVPRRGRFAEVAAGRVAGCLHRCTAWSGTREVVSFEHPQEVEPSAEGRDTGDFVEVMGKPPITLSIIPEIDGALATPALVVNSIPRLLCMPPGLWLMTDLPVSLNPSGHGRRKAGSPGPSPECRDQASPECGTGAQRAASRGDWVKVRMVLLPPGKRAPQVPDDTQATPLVAGVNGFLEAENASLGETVSVRTLAGRLVKGELVEVNPGYFHGFGGTIPPLMEAKQELRQAMATVPGRPPAIHPEAP